MLLLCRDLPIGAETPTNCPFSRAGPVLGTKLPKRIPRSDISIVFLQTLRRCPVYSPIAMARIIHTARKRSNQPSPLNAETLSGMISFSICCLSISSGTTEGGAVDMSQSGDDLFAGHFDILVDCRYSLKVLCSCVDVVKRVYEWIN
jgi:hypothetical protein